MKKTVLFSALVCVLNIASANDSFGLEIGTDSITNGKGSISTGKNSIAIGTGAVATGDNLSGEKIEAILKENQNQLGNIDGLKRQIAKSEKEYADKLQTWERVERANAEIAKNNEIVVGKLTPELMALNVEYDKFKPEHDAIVSDMNQRLNMVSQLDFTLIGKDPKGLEQLAIQLKNEIEEGYSFSLDQKFYEGYIDNYVESLGSLNKTKAILTENYRQLRNEDSDLWLSASSPRLGSSIFSNSVAVNLNTGTITAYSKADNGEALNQEQYDKWYLEESTSREWAIKNIDSFKHLYLTDKEKNRLKKAVNLHFEVQNNVQLSKLYLQKYYDASKEFGAKSPEALAMLKEKEKHDILYKEYAKEFKLGGYEKEEVGAETIKELKNYIKNIENGNIESKKALESEFNNAIADTTNRYNKLNADIKSKEKEIADIERKNAQLKPSDKELEEAKLVESVKKKLDADKEALANALEALELNYLTDIGQNAIAMGHDTLTTGKNAIGMGTDTLVTGENGVGIGNNVIVTGENGVAIGAENTVSGKNGVAIGFGNIATAVGSIAIGYNASSTAENAIAIGASSTANKENTVSFGNDTIKRQLTNVAEGDISEKSSDVITGSQLNDTNKRVDSTEADIKTNAGNITKNTEAIQDTNKRVDSTEADIKTNAGNISKNTEAIQDTNKRVDSAEADIKTNAGNISKNTEAIQDTNKRVDSTEADIKANAGNISKNTEAIQDTNKRVDSAEADIKTNAGNITKNTEAIQDTNKRVDSAEADIKTNAGNITKNTEAIQDTNKRVDSTEADIKTNAGNITKNTEAIQDTNKRIDSAEADIKTNAGNIAKNTDRINDLDGRLTSSELEIKVNTEDIKQLDGRLTTAEADIKINADNITKNTEAIQDTNKRVDSAETDIKTNTGNISKNTEAIQDMNKRVDSTEADIKTNAGNISKNTEAIQDTNKRVDSTEADIKTNAGNITKNIEAIQDTNKRVDSTEADIKTNAGNITKNIEAIQDMNKRVDSAEADIKTNAGNITKNTEDIVKAKDSIVKTNQTVKNYVSDISKHFGGNAYIDKKGNLVAPEYILNDQNFDNVGDSLTYLNDQIKNNSGLFKVDGEQIVIRENEQTSQATTVNMGGRVVTGVAKGEVSEQSVDAVNGAQLWQTNQKIDDIGREVVHINNTINHYGNRINNIERTVNQNRKKASAGIASAMAMGSIPYVESMKYSFGMGVASFDGESAISMGIEWKFNGDQARFRINGAYDSQNKLGVGIGVAFGF